MLKCVCTELDRAGIVRDGDFTNYLGLAHTEYRQFLTSLGNGGAYHTHEGIERCAREFGEGLFLNWQNSPDCGLGGRIF
jgi:hypothetical protein